TLTVVGSGPRLNVGGSLTVDSGGVMNVGAGIALASPCTNSGTINFTNGSLQILNNGSAASELGGLVNESGGVIELWGSASISGSGGQDYFINQGTITKEINSGPSTVYINATDFDNGAGTVNNLAGSLDLTFGTGSRPGNLGGTYNSP